MGAAQASGTAGHSLSPRVTRIAAGRWRARRGFDRPIRYLVSVNVTDWPEMQPLGDGRPENSAMEDPVEYQGVRFELIVQPDPRLQHAQHEEEPHAWWIVS